jgi:hypothetical protein
MMSTATLSSLAVGTPPSAGDLPSFLVECWSRLLKRPAARACVVDGAQLTGMPVRPQRQPIEQLDEIARTKGRGAVLVLDHQHEDAVDELRKLQHQYPELFAGGAIVVGVENVPAGGQAVLNRYRELTSRPVFGIDLGNPHDLLLLHQALVLTRIAAEMLHRT